MKKEKKIEKKGKTLVKKEKEIKKKVGKGRTATKTTKKIEIEPKTMDELLSLSGLEVRTFKKGELVKGLITGIKNKAIYIDVGGKTDGIVTDKEFMAVKDYVGSLNVGDEVEVRVQTVENDKGQTILSLKGAAVGFGWDFFEEKMKTGEEIEVFGRELNRGGLVVVASFGFLGFIPGSQIGSGYDHDPERMLRKKVKVKVLEVDKEKNRLVFSERLVSEPDRVEEEEKMIEEIKVGKEFEAAVVRVEPFGIFVKVSLDKLTLEGLVHISEISWEKVDNLSGLFKVGDQIRTLLISKEEGRLQFSVKRLLPDPWKGIDKRYPKDREIEGEVVRLANFGALVRLEAGVEGLVHVSKFTPETKMVLGDKIRVYIESLDVERRKISLGLVLTQKPLIYK